jgi:hypothetical protein
LGITGAGVANLGVAKERSAYVYPLAGPEIELWGSINITICI